MNTLHRWQPYTTEEAYVIIKDRLNGVKIPTITKKYGRTKSAIATLSSEFKIFKEEGRVKAPKKLQLFTDVMSMLADKDLRVDDEKVRGYLSQDTATETKDVERVDPYKRIETSLQSFIDAVIGIAREQVAEQTKKQLEDQKNHYEKELLHYQELQVIAEESNMVGYIKKRLGLVNGEAHE